MSNCNPIPRSLQKTFGERQCGNSSNKRKEDQQRLLGPLWDLKEKMGNLHSFGGKGILDTSPNFSLELQETVTLLTFPFSLKNSIMFWTSWVLNLSPLLPPAPHSYVPSVVSPLVWLDHPPGWSHLFHSSLHHHALNLLPGLPLSSIGHCRSSANPQMPRNPFNILLIGYQVKNKPLDLGPGLISREISMPPSGPSPRSSPNVPHTFRPAWTPLVQLLQMPRPRISRASSPAWNPSRPPSSRTWSLHPLKSENCPAIHIWTFRGLTTGSLK